MSKQSPPALDEIVQEFTQAREELGKVASTLREFESIADERKGERAALEVSAAAVSETASRLYRLAETLDAAVSSVAEVLGAAESALRATDAGQLMERLTSLETSVVKSVEGLEGSYRQLDATSKDLQERVVGQASQLDSLRADVQAQGEERGQLVERVTSMVEAQSRGLSEKLSTLEEGLPAKIEPLETRVTARLEGTEALVSEMKQVADATRQQVDALSAKQDEFGRLHQENTALRQQLDRVRNELKPRQLAALGLAE